MSAQAPGERPLIVIVGPTAAGKSALAMAAAEALGGEASAGEIVSADSVQVYRGLDVGSAKPSPEQRARVPHHCLDLLEPVERGDAAVWAAHADRAIADIRSRGRRAIVCGGTGLYVRALMFGLADVPAVDPAVEAAVAAELSRDGAEALHATLRAVDPEAAARLHPQDRQRVGRALAVFRATGRPLSALQAAHGFGARRYEARTFTLWPDRASLYSRIAARARAMLAMGLVDEVRALLAAGVPADAPGLSTLGYREVVAHLQGAIAADDLAERVITGHRRYAKRQLTWFRGVLARDLAPVHLDPDDRPLERLLFEVAAPDG